MGPALATWQLCLSTVSFLSLKAEIDFPLILTCINQWVNDSWHLGSIWYGPGPMLHLLEQSSFHLIPTTTLVVHYGQSFLLYRWGNWGLIMSLAQNLTAFNRYSRDLNPGSLTPKAILLPSKNTKDLFSFFSYCDNFSSLEQGSGFKLLWTSPTPRQ